MISAGYGLVAADSSLHPYSATFAKTSLDAVCPSPGSGSTRRRAHQAWWTTLSSLKDADGLHPSTIAELAEGHSDGGLLVVASPDYLAAAESDLLRAASALTDAQRLIIVSSNGGVALQSLEAYTVPSDARLQSIVGGVLGSLHANVASLILKNVRDWGFTAEGVRSRLLELIKGADGPTRYDREAMNDDAIRTFVRDALRRNPPPSCTSLLRELRGSGRACEQKRFKNLYHEVRLEGTLFSPQDS